MNKSYHSILTPLWEQSQDGTELDLLNTVQRNIIQVQLFEDQINGNGFDSIFYNGGGQLAYSSLEALKAIDSIITTKILQDGINLFPVDPIPYDIEECRNTMDSIPDKTFDKWHKLADLFYKKEENLMALKMNYILKNPLDFNLESIEEKTNNLPEFDTNGDLIYYVCEQDLDYMCLINDDSFDPYLGVSFNLGMNLKLPKIILKSNIELLPDAIPNDQNILIVNSKIREVLDRFKVDYIQYFDVDIMLKSGQICSGQYKSLNLLNVVDVINKEKSNIEWSEIDEDEDEDDRYPNRIYSLVLNLSNLKMNQLFKINQFELPLIMRADIVNELLKLDIKGFHFYNVKELTL